ncbi:hypothetical protein [Pseudosulfitobacter sp. DSM 107133]|uniref:hypothetical protein n=1 Tax=Pseudosulfitobacter sp. DSM 107133 TaxID=2883100 RepID=UPI0013B3C8A5|nr:hypothetical protein [Pseudosulfitobacter sp. DSM 107133]UOA30235.1 hypothetical protein DSM107133_04999 [Pseudosulfitobacter sp. DSM 107133]
MGRKPLLDSLDMEMGQGDSAEKVVPIKAAATSDKPIKTSLYLPPKALKRMKELALAQDCKVHDLVIQGVDHVLTSKGFPTVAEHTRKE